MIEPLFRFELKNWTRLLNKFLKNGWFFFTNSVVFVCWWERDFGSIVRGFTITTSSVCYCLNKYSDFNDHNITSYLKKRFFTQILTHLPSHCLSSWLLTAQYWIVGQIVFDDISGREAWCLIIKNLTLNLL